MLVHSKIFVRKGCEKPQFPFAVLGKISKGHPPKASTGHRLDAGLALGQDNVSNRQKHESWQNANAVLVSNVHTSLLPASLKIEVTSKIKWKDVGGALLDFPRRPKSFPLLKKARLLTSLAAVGCGALLPLPPAPVDRNERAASLGCLPVAAGGTGTALREVGARGARVRGARPQLAPVAFRGRRALLGRPAALLVARPVHLKGDGRMSGSQGKEHCT